MKISHEVPLDLLNSSLTFNDYQYCLPHYYIKYPKYKEFFISYRNMKESFIMLDNGLFEGGVLPEPKLIEIIKEIQPDIFILPDVWNNAYETISNADRWMEKIKPELPTNTKLMVVLQGKTFSDIQQCLYSSLGGGISHFGLNHSSLAYTDMFYHKNPLISKTMGRILTFNKLIEEDVFDKFKKCYIHFLGLNLPQEMLYVNNKELISSVDTSNPVINGIQGIRYSELGLLQKPEEKIELFMEKDLASNLEDIIFNISTFRKWTY